MYRHYRLGMSPLLVGVLGSLQLRELGKQGAVRVAGAVDDPPEALIG